MTFFGGMLLVLTVLIGAPSAFYLLAIRPKSPGDSTQSSATPQKWVVAGVILVLVGLSWWFWDTISESLWWRMVPLALISIICFRWAKSKNKGLLDNIGNATLVLLLVVMLVSAPGRSIGDSFDAGAENVAEHGVSALLPNIGGCPGTFSAGEVIVVRRGCTAEVMGFPAGGEFHPLDARFSESLTVYVDMEQPYPGYITLKPNEGFPSGVSEVTIRIISAEEARRIAAVRAVAVQ